MRVCVRCNETPLPAKSRKSYCDDCARVTYRENRFLAQTKALERGQCRNCYKPRGADGTAQHCRPCADAANEYAKERRRRLIAEGRCPACRRRHDLPTNLCEQCASVEAENKRRRRST